MQGPGSTILNVSPQSLLSTGRGVGVGESSTAQQSVEEFRARQARTRLYYTECESSVASFHRRREWAWGRRAPLEESAPFWGREPF